MANPTEIAHACLASIAGILNDHVATDVVKMRAITRIMSLGTDALFGLLPSVMEPRPPPYAPAVEEVDDEVAAPIGAPPPGPYGWHVDAEVAAPMASRASSSSSAGKGRPRPSTAGSQPKTSSFSSAGVPKPKASSSSSAAVPKRLLPKPKPKVPLARPIGARSAPTETARPKPWAYPPPAPR